jgi:hypothetical protein
MAGFRANTNRCGAFPSLSRGKAHPRGSLVSGATAVTGYQLIRQDAIRSCSRCGHDDLPRGPLTFNSLVVGRQNTTRSK